MEPSKPLILTIYSKEAVSSPLLVIHVLPYAVCDPIWKNNVLTDLLENTNKVST